ncbi:hypothetical protein AB4099_34020 [Bosea sp. 2KB_26]|uniref:hypothetical protein n=1 Tax=Bosea sp. 2KB_26 TaxID=3237475 RepID=UPI003F8FBCA6
MGGKSAKAEAKRWIREHWATFIRLSDPPADHAGAKVPALALTLWPQECQRIAQQIDGSSALDRALQHQGDNS